MAIYGFVRSSASKRERRPEAQVEEFTRKAKELGGCLLEVFVEPDSPGKKTSLLDGPVGKRMLNTLRAQDRLLIHSLDRLGYSVRDVEKTLGVLAEREVLVYPLRGVLEGRDIEPPLGRALPSLFAMRGQIERTLRSERFAELARQRKEQGLAYGGVSIGKRIVRRGGAKVLEWDMDQLAIISEIARRLPSEGAAKVAEDLWKRRIRDARGRLWGKPVPKHHTRVQKVKLALRYYLGTYRSPSPYRQFHRVTRWFHRMKRQGLLPPPYDNLAQSIEEPKNFREEPRPKGWTRGGTARREQERANRRAETRAERQARWQKEKEARLTRRVHKPVVAKLGAARKPPKSEGLGV